MINLAKWVPSNLEGRNVEMRYSWNWKRASEADAYLWRAEGFRGGLRPGESGSVTTGMAATISNYPTFGTHPCGPEKWQSLWSTLSFVLVFFTPKISVKNSTIKIYDLKRFGFYATGKFAPTIYGASFSVMLHKISLYVENEIWRVPKTCLCTSL